MKEYQLSLSMDWAHRKDTFLQNNQISMEQIQGCRRNIKFLSFYFKQNPIFLPHTRIFTNPHSIAKTLKKGGDFGHFYWHVLGTFWAFTKKGPKFIGPNFLFLLVAPPTPLLIIITLRVGRSGTAASCFAAGLAGIIRCLNRTTIKNPTESGIFYGGASQNRTGDTRIFSPLLYRLS